MNDSDEWQRKDRKEDQIGPIARLNLAHLCGEKVGRGPLVAPVFYVLFAFFYGHSKRLP
jgi:hypothetical protein